MKGVIQPTSYVYRFIVRRPLRRGIQNVQRNVAYPVRLINNLLQGKFGGARVETERFLVNTVVGVGGLFDVATRWEIGSSDEDFGQTFGTWGWRPNLFLMLPIRGPTSDRDAIGSIGDAAANPATYFSPAPMIFSYNNLADAVFQYNAFVGSQQDPYSNGRDFWALQREASIEPLIYQHEDTPATQTLRALFFDVKEDRFPRRGDVREVKAPSTGLDFPYTVWLQPKNRARGGIVYILPGIGDHRLNGGPNAMAELAYEAGHSVVLISSTFSFEFIRRGLSSTVPGYPARDVRDIYGILDTVHRALTARDLPRDTPAILLGVSLGAFQTLYLAAHPEIESGDLRFSRYVAVNPPVDLVYGLQQLDAFYNAPLQWLDPIPNEISEADREYLRKKVKQTLLKGTAIAAGWFRPNTRVPYTDIEAKYLVGASFRLLLRDTIFVSQSRYNLGVLKQPVRYWKRRALYNEIQQYSFAGYLEHFLFREHGRFSSADMFEEQLLFSADLKNSSDRLRSMDNIYLIGTENDFLLSPEDLQWLKGIFPDERAALIPEGGHLGNLHLPKVQSAIRSALRAGF